MTNELGPGERPSTFLVGEPDSSGTTVTISEAARRSGVSVSTLRRRLTKGQVPGAHKAPGPDGEEWRIPVAALDGLGPVDTPSTPRTTTDDLQRQLDEERRARLHAEELLAAERRHNEQLASSIDGLRESLATLAKALPPAPAPIEGNTGRTWFRRNKAPKVTS
jgi:DNA-binding transcriptional MerR regulator